MTQTLDTQVLAIDTAADPVLLAVMLMVFLVGAVGPFALCVFGSIREERALRRYAADRLATASANAVDPAVVRPAAIPLGTVTVPAETATAANDSGIPPIIAVENDRLAAG